MSDAGQTAREPGAAGSVGSAARPTVAGVAVTDLSAALGAVAWLIAVGVGGLATVERALALAPLTLVPLGAGMAATPPFSGPAGRLHRGAVLLQPLGALGLLLSLTLPVERPAAAALAAPWLVVTGLLALAGATRTLDRGPRPLAETAVDAGLAYATVGAAALLFSHLGITFWFDPAIVLLTAVHFHYAGFVLPVVTGLAGRCAPAAGSRFFRAVTAVVIVGPAIVAVGISFSPLVEVLAVGAFTLAVAAFGGYVALRVAPARGGLQGLLLATAALALPLSMLLALGYAVRVFAGVDPLGLTLSRMVRLHGSLNAYGFALLATLAWRLSVPPARSAEEG